MRNKLIALALTLALAGNGSAADQSSTDTPAPVSSGQLSVLSGRTVGAGSTVLHGELGWPGLNLGLLHGLSSKLDVGGKLGLLYGYEGITAMSGVPGMRLQGVLRLELLERSRLNLGLRFSPGMVFYFFPGMAYTGITLPVELAMGLSLVPSLMLNFNLELPTLVMFGYYGGFVLPMRLGAGLEYAIDRTIGLTFSLRGGPSSVTGYYYGGPYSVCYDRLGRSYYCGGTMAASAEMLVGLSFKL